MNTLKCGHISKSKDKINYFVNDINSLLYVIIPIFDYAIIPIFDYAIIPIFDYVNLNSSNL